MLCGSEILSLTSVIQNRDGESSNKSELRILVHQSHAGAVIGRGGKKIREIREETGAHLKVCFKNIKLVIDLTLTSV